MKWFDEISISGGVASLYIPVRSSSKSYAFPFLYRTKELLLMYTIPRVVPTTVEVDNAHPIQNLSVRVWSDD